MSRKLSFLSLTRNYIFYKDIFKLNLFLTIIYILLSITHVKALKEKKTLFWLDNSVDMWLISGDVMKNVLL